MEKRVACPYCGYKMPIRIAESAAAHGLFIRCKGRRCGKEFEIVIKENKSK